MACTGEMRFDALMRELDNAEKESLSQKDILAIKEDLGKGLRPEFHPERFSRSKTAKELGFDKVFPDLTGGQLGAKKNAFFTAVEKLNSGQKLTKNQEDTYNKVKDWFTNVEDDGKSRFLEDGTQGDLESFRKVNLSPNKADSTKAPKKLSKATKFIGFGAPGSSTAKYASVLSKDHADRVNSGKYTSDDIVFLSINGKGKITEENFNKTLEEAKKALDAGATILLDDNKNSSREYNSQGEGKLKEELSKNYKYGEKDGIGLFKGRKKQKKYKILKKLDNGKIVFNNMKPSIKTSKVSDIEDLLSDIDRNITEDEKRSIDLLLSSINGDIEIKLQENLGKAGIQYAGRNSIGIDIANIKDNSIDPYAVIIHEIGHLVTEKEINSNPSYRKRIKKLMNEALKHNPQWKDTYAFTNEHEFTATLLEKQDLRDELDKIVYGKKTILDHIKDILNHFLKNVKNNDKRTLLSESLAVVFDKSHEPNFDKDYNKGSSDDIVELTPETALMNDLLTENNLGDVFSRVVQEVDMASGKVLNITQDYYDHMDRVLKIIQDVMKNNGTKIDFSLGVTDSTNTKGMWTPDFDFENQEDRDAIKVLFNPADKTSSASEVMLHELLHSLFKRAFDSDLKMRKAFEDLRREVKKQLGPDVFTIQMVQEGATSLTPEDEKLIQRKFDYILSDGADIEEFMAYAMSNSYLFDAIKDIQIQDVPSKVDEALSRLAEVRKLKGSGNKIFGIINRSIDVLTAYLSEILRKIFSPKQNIGKTGDEIMKQTLQDVHAFQLKQQFLLANETFSDTLRGYSNAPLFIGQSLETAATVIDAMGAVTGPIEDGVRKILEQKDKIISKLDPKSNKVVANAIDGIQRISFMKKILTSRVLKNLMFQNFTTNKYQALLQLKRQKQAIEAMMTNISAEITNIVSNTELANPDNTYNSYVYVNRVLKSGMYEYIDEFDYSSMSLRSQAKRKANEALDELSKSYNMTDSVKEHLDAIAKWTLDGKVHIENQQINPQNVLLRYFDPLRRSIGESKVTATNKDIELANKYVTMKALESMTDDELIAIEVMHENPKLNEEMKHVTKLYKSRIEAYKNSEFIDNSRFNSLPFGFIDNKTGTAKYQISLVHDNDIKTFKSTVGKIELIDSFEIGGEKFYRVKHGEDAVPYEDGVLGSISIGVKGNGIKSIIAALYNAKKISTPDSMKDLTVAQFTDKMLKQMLSQKKDDIFKSDDGLVLMPKHDKNGRLIDWILPLSDDDIKSIGAPIDIMSSLPYTIERLVNARQTSIHNRKAVDVIEQFYSDTKYDDKYSKKDFIVISKNKNKDLWDKLSPSVKKYINDMHNGVLHLPDEILELMIGSRSASLANISMSDINPFSNNKDLLIKSYKIRKAIKTAEKIWGEILNKNKTVAILFNPDIGVGNFISNMMLMWSHGVNPYRYIKEFRNKWYQLEEYQDLSRQRISLALRKNFGEDVDDKLKILNKRIDLHPFAKLVKDGQFTAMIDDISDEPEGYIGHLINDLTEKGKNDREYYTQVVVEAYRRKAERGGDVNKYISEVEKELKNNKWKFRIPAELARTRALLYGSNGTQAHRTATQITMFADTLARQMLLEHMIKKKELTNKRKLTKREQQDILDFVDEQFINYGYNVSGLQMWVERVFGIQFLKYLFQHHKAYWKVIKRNPSAVAAQQTAQHVTGINIADPMDTLVDHGPADNIINRWQSDDPIEVISNLVTPNITTPLGIFDTDAWFKVYH